MSIRREKKIKWKSLETLKKEKKLRKLAKEMKIHNHGKRQNQKSWNRAKKIEKDI